MRIIGLYAFMPLSVFLTVSYFVLFANSKVEAGGLKTFGKVVAVLLWIAAGLILSTGLYILGTGVHPMGRMHGMMR